MGITKLLAILKLIADWINRYLVRREHKKAQQSHDQLEEAPNEWFDQHFAGSGSDDRVRPDADSPATETDQANTGDRANRASNAPESR